MDRKILSNLMLLSAAALLIVAIVFGFLGFNKINEYSSGESYPYEIVNAYVGGDAYNYIINGTYFSGYMSIASGFLIAASLFALSGLFFRLSAEPVICQIKAQDALPSGSPSNAAEHTSVSGNIQIPAPAIEEAHKTAGRIATDK